MTTRTTKVTLGVLAFITALAAAAVLAHGTGITKPAASEFGFGPRVSRQGLYTATLEVPHTLKPRKMYSIGVNVRDVAGRPVDGASIEIDGGMPQHAHGFPTRPRITANQGNGVYQISGLRFNMGGWWELTLSIRTAAGTDTVTFNLAL